MGPIQLSHSAEKLLHEAYVYNSRVFGSQEDTSPEKHVSSAESALWYFSDEAKSNKTEQTRQQNQVRSTTASVGCPTHHGVQDSTCHLAAGEDNVQKGNKSEPTIKDVPFESASNEDQLSTLLTQSAQLLTIQLAEHALKKLPSVPMAAKSESSKKINSQGVCGLSEDAITLNPCMKSVKYDPTKSPRFRKRTLPPWVLSGELKPESIARLEDAAQLYTSKVWQHLYHSNDDLRGVARGRNGRTLEDVTTRSGSLYGMTRETSSTNPKAQDSIETHQDIKQQSSTSSSHTHEINIEVHERNSDNNYGRIYQQRYCTCHPHDQEEYEADRLDSEEEVSIEQVSSSLQGFEYIPLDSDESCLEEALLLSQGRLTNSLYQAHAIISKAMMEAESCIEDSMRSGQKVACASPAFSSAILSVVRKMKKMVSPSCLCDDGEDDVFEEDQSDVGK